MSTTRTTVLAMMLIGLAGGPALAATCNLTVQGARILDDEVCTVAAGRGTTRVAVGSYGTILIRGTAMSVQVVGQPSVNRHHRSSRVSLGSVVMSKDSDAPVCYFGQKATLCVDP